MLKKNNVGTSFGETDEYGYNIASDGVHIHDLHATLLHQLGIDHERLTFKYQGRWFRLTDVHGHVVKQIILSGPSQSPSIEDSILIVSSLEDETRGFHPQFVTQ